MRKIAAPQDLQSELRRLLAYSQSHQPSRQVLASELMDLADRVAVKASSSIENTAQKAAASITRLEGILTKASSALVKQEQLVQRSLPYYEAKVKEEKERFFAAYEDIVDVFNDLKKEVDPFLREAEADADPEAFRTASTEWGAANKAFASLAAARKSGRSEDMVMMVIGPKAQALKTILTPFAHYLKALVK
jgi:hypothetical protein